jgi:hypothetical protein
MRLTPDAGSIPDWLRGNKEKFVSECYVLRLETSRPVLCEKAAVEIMYHLQQSASSRSLATLWGCAKGIQVLHGDLCPGSLSAPR